MPRSASAQSKLLLSKVNVYCFGRLLSECMYCPVKRMNPFHVIGCDASNPLRGFKLDPDGCLFQKVSICGEGASSLHECVLFVGVFAVG